MTVFQTARLIVRELTLADLDDMFVFCRDPEVMKYVGDLKPFSYERTRQEIEYAQESYREHGFGEWAFVEMTSNRLAGYGGLLMPPHSKIPEVSYLLAREFWGKGYATEVATAIVTYAFTQLELEEVGASLDPGNAASRRVLEKIGMLPVGRGVDQYGLPILLYERRNPNPLD